MAPRLIRVAVKFLDKGGEVPCNKAPAKRIPVLASSKAVQLVKASNTPGSIPALVQRNLTLNIIEVSPYSPLIRSESQSWNEVISGNFSILRIYPHKSIVPLNVSSTRRLIQYVPMVISGRLQGV